MRHEVHEVLEGWTAFFILSVPFMVNIFLIDYTSASSAQVNEKRFVILDVQRENSFCAMKYMKIIKNKTPTTNEYEKNRYFLSVVFFY